MRQTSAVVFIAIDTIVPVRGKSLAGFEEFGAQLDHAGVPVVWVTARSRMQMDEPRRKFGHQHPFIGEDGSGVSQSTVPVPWLTATISPVAFSTSPRTAVTDPV